MKLPSYVKHIQHPVNTRGYWCDAKWRREFVFTGLDHVAANALSEGRLLACPACVQVATEALDSGTFNEGYAHHDRIQEICRELHKKYQLYSGIATDDPLYKEMVALGSEAVPALLYRLDQLEGDWDGLAIWEPLAALHEITEVNVVLEEDRGRLRPIIEHWLDWGERQGIYERIQWGD